MRFMNIFLSIKDKGRELLLKSTQPSMLLTLKNNVKSVLLSRKMKPYDIFFWDKGLLACALETVAREEKDQQCIEAVNQYYLAWIKRGCPIFCLDDCLSAYAVLCLQSSYPEIKINVMIQAFNEYLSNYPKDEKGSFFYSKTMRNEILIDSIGMLCPYLSKLGKQKKWSVWYDVAKKQIMNFIEFGFDEFSGLPYHGYNSITNIKLGIIGWGRGVGWFLLGLVGCLENMYHDDSDYDRLRGIFIQVATTTLAYQRSDGYYSWQLSASEGPVDTSATAMISWALLKWVHLGNTDINCIPAISNAVNALKCSYRDGEIYDCSAECRGLSMYPQKYNSYLWSLGPTIAVLSLYNTCCEDLMLRNNF